MPAFIATGTLLGISYLLITKAVHADRNHIEVFLDDLRGRLKSGPVPVLEWAHPFMLGALYGIYGRRALRRIVVSAGISVFFTCFIFLVVYWRSSYMPGAAFARKEQLEIEVDPVLYKYITDPQLKRVYDDAQREVFHPVVEDVWFPTEYVYKGGIYDDLRNRRENFPNRFADALQKDPARVELTLLYLIYGNYFSEGFQWGDSLALLLFNILFDFMTATIVIACLRYLPDRPGVARAMGAFTVAAFGTALCSTACVVGYRVFFRGDPAFFAQLLVALPVGIALLVTSIIAIPMVVFGLIDVVLAILGSRRRHKESPNIFNWIVAGFFSFLIGIGLTRYVWFSFRKLDFALVDWKSVLTFPYVLAATTLIPVTITMTVFGLILLAKLTVEPMRVISWAYLTFSHDEVKGTQAAGLIIILSAILASLFSVFWPGPP